MNKKSIVRPSDEELDQYGKPLIDRLGTAHLISRALLRQGRTFSWSCIGSGAVVSSGAGSPAAFGDPKAWGAPTESTTPAVSKPDTPLKTTGSTPRRIPASSGVGRKACRVPLEVKPVPTICPVPLAEAAPPGADQLLSLSSTEMVVVPSTATSGRL